MLLERTITTLQSRSETPERARELARLGYIQWLAFLDADASYTAEAQRALALAAPFTGTDPAVAAFCDLVRQSLTGTPGTLDLSLPCPRRRGGARERRRML
ncbi:hypothetical protein [Chachezhania antarctica]|uniref:hypothetical protein n=1 Tax=Chachezhania antarctica TaxID=2340860 RepID=UPI0013CF257D|nr:hypothetical protein [Chachezhania antarctica]|tara:strand:- start:2247 stop:2549 length:303 start_codon:yes stop_codon:yes gene_type:complete